MALADESNRYQPAKSVAKVTRMPHRPRAGYDERGLQMARLLQTRSSRSQQAGFEPVHVAVPNEEAWNRTDNFSRLERPESPAGLRIYFAGESHAFFLI